MTVEGGQVATRIVDRQFEMLGLKTRFCDIPEDGIVQNGKKKKDKWYNVYTFTEEQEKEWQDWMLVELRKMCKSEKDVQDAYFQIDMLYGFHRRYRKDGELF